MHDIRNGILLGVALVVVQAMMVEKSVTMARQFPYSELVVVDGSMASIRQSHRAKHRKAMLSSLVRG